MVRTSRMNALGGPVILARGGLVEDQRRRLEGQRDRQGEALLLPERERQRGSLEDVLERVERRSGAARRRRCRSNDSAGRVQVPRAEHRAPRGRSGRRASGSGSGRRSRRSSRGSATVRPAIDAPSTRTSPPRAAIRPHRGPEQRRLARAVRAEHGDDLPGARARRRRRGGPRARRSRRARRGTRAAGGVAVGGVARACGSVAVAGSARRPGAPSRRNRSRTTSNGSLTAVGSATSRKPADVAEVARPALLEVQHPIRPEVERLLDAVLDDDDGVALVGEAPQGREEPRGGRRVEVGERLVDDVQARLEHQDAGHREELALAAGQAAVSRPSSASMPGRRRRPRGSGRRISPAVHAEVLRAEGELGLDRRADDLPGRILEHRADAAARSRAASARSSGGRRRGPCPSARPGRHAG